MRIPIEIRKYEVGDLDFIYSTWLKNYYASSLFAKRIPRQIFFRKHHAVIEQILLRGAVRDVSDVTVLVAVAPEDRATIIGYLAYEPGCIHFIYVKSTFRGFGVARALVEKAQLDLSRCRCSHWTFMVDELAKKYPQLTYDPYLMAEQPGGSNERADEAAGEEDRRAAEGGAG